MNVRKLNQISVKAKQDKKLKFTSLIHHVNEVSLAQCYKELRKQAACGVDGVTVEEYGRNLDDNIRKLVQKLKDGSYRSQPVRRVYIPKPGKAEKRGLGIPTVEDKLLQLMVKKLLEAIYEADFLDCSYGFRPKLSCHDAIKRLDKVVMSKPINYMVEVDIRKFFDNVQHNWLIRCLEERIQDQKLLWLVRKFLKAGTIEAGNYEASECGAPQGGVASPLLANIYLHYILDLWFMRIHKPKAKGYMELIRYCDDFVVCCENKADAENFLEELKGRLAKFGLSIASDKTQVIEFGKRVWKQPQKDGKKVATFNFLGFTHYRGKSQKGYFMIKHKTSKSNFSRKIKEINEWLKAIRSVAPLREWWPVLKAKLVGHYNYFGISSNYRCIKRFYERVVQVVFKWINRRGGKNMTWKVFAQYLQWNPLPQPKITYSLYTPALQQRSHIEEPYVGNPPVGFCGGYHGNETIIKE